jgi:3-methyladenine DNA glycosylase AlkD
MQRYMKSAMPYRGLASPTLRAITREVFPRYPLASFQEWRETVLTLWDEAAFREERYAAIELVAYRAYRSFRTLEALPLYEYLIVSGAWWDLVDGLATHQVGDLLRQYPHEMRQRLLAWSRGDDVWLRRTAIIAQVSFRGSTDQVLLYACIEPSLAERDFFLRKAIGWALREYAKAAPDNVRQYVAQHEAELSGLSRREALKHLEPRLQSEAASV